MQSDLVEYIVKNYHLTSVYTATPVTTGFLSENYVLQTEREKYFLKQYRYVKPQTVAAVHAAKFFFAQANVPVILPYRNKKHDTFFAFENKYYSLFPFVEGRHLQRGCFSTQALHTTAEMLAKIHRTGQHANPFPVQKSQSKLDYERFVTSAQQILNIISRQERTAFNELAAECVSLKLHLAEQQRAAFTAIDLVSDHLIHGDYQEGNLFFDKNEQVSHVFDWEKSSLAPRGLELVRAIEFICFSNPNDYKAVFSEENYGKARQFLQSYHQAYPILLSEFFVASQLRYLQKILSLWVETEHYLENSKRVDVFLEAEYNTIKYYSHSLQKHIECISGGITHV